MSSRKRVRAGPATPEQRAEIDAILAQTEGRPRSKPAIEQTEAGSTTSMTNQAFHAMLGVIRQLKHEREKQGKTAAEVARKAGIDPAMLSRLETGRVPNPTFETLSKIANALGLGVHLSVGDQPDQQRIAGNVLHDPLEQLVLAITRAIGPQKVIYYLATRDASSMPLPPDSSIVAPERGREPAGA
jgi:transcriptional regulator with XRE-family HTH domain